jgi:ABC-type transporter Mla MlaB component
MIRITATEGASQITITIDGDLSGEHVAAVETCCREAESNGKPVQVFLRDVTAVDQGGQMLLRRLARAGVGLVANGVYTSYLVQALTSRDAKNPEVLRPG